MALVTNSSASTERRPFSQETDFWEETGIAEAGDAVFKGAVWRLNFSDPFGNMLQCFFDLIDEDQAQIA